MSLALMILCLVIHRLQKRDESRGIIDGIYILGDDQVDDASIENVSKDNISGVVPVAI